MNLLLVASSDIRDSPTSFLHDALFIIIGQQIQKTRQCFMADNALRGNKKTSISYNREAREFRLDALGKLRLETDDFHFLKQLEILIHKNGEHRLIFTEQNINYQLSNQHNKALIPEFANHLR